MTTRTKLIENIADLILDNDEIRETIMEAARDEVEAQGWDFEKDEDLAFERLHTIYGELLIEACRHITNSY